VKISGYYDVTHPASIALLVENQLASLGNPAARAIKADGTVEVTEDLLVGTTMRLSQDGGEASIEGLNTALRLGESVHTTSVVIGYNDPAYFVQIAAPLLITNPVNALGAGIDLILGSDSQRTRDVLLGNAANLVKSPAAIVDLEGELRVGPAASAGLIDSGGVAGAATDRDLKLGTQTVTQDVYLSRNGQTTVVNGGLSVSQSSNLSGSVSMG